MAATARVNSIDSGRDERQEAAGNEETICRPSRQSELCAGEEFRRKFSKILPVSINSPTMSV